MSHKKPTHILNKPEVIRPTHHNEVHQGHGVKRDVPPVHQSADVHDDHRDRRDDHQGREYIETHEQERHDEYGQQGYADAPQRVRQHR